MRDHQNGLAVSTHKGALMPLSSSASFRTATSWAIAAAVSLLFAVGLAAAPVATADTCANAIQRAQNNSNGLPDCRAYEMVSSPYKEGFAIDQSVWGATDDGIALYGTIGNIGNDTQGLVPNRYHASRTSGGWTTAAIAAAEAIYDTKRSAAAAESSDLRWSLWQMRRRNVPEDKFSWYLRGPDGAFTRIGDAEDPTLGLTFLAGASDDLSHIVFNHGLQGGAPSRLREYVGTGNDGPPRAVSIDNNGQPTQSETCANDVSADGRVILYTAGCGGGVPQVWARVGGSASVAVSGSECTRPFGHPDGACNGVSAADYAGAAEDGSRVFFTTSQQLVNGDIDQTNDLYACDIPAGAPAPIGAANPCASLMQVSGAASGAQVGSVPVVSEDGSRVYFVAAGAALADNLDVNDAAAVAGQPNLYVWTKDATHPAGEVRFVAKLAADDMSQSELTPDGRYLAFTTANALVTNGPGSDDDGGARDVYRYDATTHTMVRPSTSVTGSGGNDTGFDVSLAERRSSTSDGATVIFQTAEGLSVADTNGVTDVYAWHDGRVSLISAGGGKAMEITASGRDIFFYTDAPVLAADRDVIRDLYTARVGGGFDPPRPPASCSGDGCQGLLSGAPSLTGPQSALSGGDADPGDVAAALSLRAVSEAQQRRLAATGKVSLTVVANAAGRVRATARAKIGGRSVTVGSGRRTMIRPGSVAVTLRLSRTARVRLARRGKLTVKVVVSHSKAAKGRSVTLRLTRSRAKSSSAGGRS